MIFNIDEPFSVAMWVEEDGRFSFSVWHKGETKFEVEGTMKKGVVTLATDS